MISRNIRNVAGLLAWLSAGGILVLLNFSLVVANYLACLVSFTLLGVDTKPLGEDELFGPLFMTVAPQATQAHLYAAVVAAAMAAGFFFMVRFLFHSIELYRDRKTFYIPNKEEQNAKAALKEIEENLLKALLLSIAMGFLVYWDIQLFRYRLTAGLFQIDSPDAASQLPNWQLQWQQNSDFYGWALTRCGAWGYVAVTALGCLLLEFGFTKVRMYFDRLVAPLDEWLQNRKELAPQPALYGYDENGAPVYDSATPLVYAPDGQPLESSEASVDAQTANRAGSSGQTPVPHTTGRDEAAFASSDPHRGATVPVDHSFEFGNGAGPRPPSTQPRVSAIPAIVTDERNSRPGCAHDTSESGDPPPTSEPRNAALFDPQLSKVAFPSDGPEEERRPPNHARGIHEVLGDSGRRMSTQEALAHPDLFHVDPASGDIWDRRFWEAIHGGPATDNTATVEPANNTAQGEN